jgi:hypothetical protein
MHSNTKLGAKKGEEEDMNSMLTISLKRKLKLQFSENFKLCLDNQTLRFSNW